MSRSAGRDFAERRPRGGARAERAVGVLLAVFLGASSAVAAPSKDDKAAGSAAPARRPPSLADTLTDEAKADYEAAKLLYNDGDFAGARVKFQGAYDRSNDPRLLWNMAACEKGLRHYAKVVTLMRQYLDTGGDWVTPQDRAEAEQFLAAVESFTVALTLVVNEPGALITIDGEPVGTSPLPGPVTVDIGGRKIEAKKDGFAPFSQTLTVGGSKDASADVKLEREVHEGDVTVSAPAGATITIDGKPAAQTHFQGKLASGGHTLRVEAPGMRPYQSEFVVQDQAARQIDVVLEPLPPPTPAREPEGPLHGFELGLRLGYGLQTNRVSNTPSLGANGTTSYHSESLSVGFVPLALDVGYRLGAPTYLGLFGEYATLDRAKTCGFARHGPHEDFPDDPSTRYGYTACSSLKLGAMFVFHVLPRAVVDPYLGFELAAHATFAQYRSFDPITGQAARGASGDSGGSFQPGIRLGVDAHPGRGVAAGLFYVFATAFGNEGVPKTTQSCGGGGNNCPTTQAQPGFQSTFGARAAYTFQ
ncbi:MAG TPA: PEGA domain-containing protein [Polyangiaceae bacterium]|nr:PEGA domain-containing protein [Polyangiaceae bacterium]